MFVSFGLPFVSFIFRYSFICFLISMVSYGFLSLFREVCLYVCVPFVISFVLALVHYLFSSSFLPSVPYCLYVLFVRYLLIDICMYVAMSFFLVHSFIVSGCL